MSGASSPTSARLEAARVLFAERPTRLALAGVAIPSDPRRSVRIRVHRNHAIEPVLALAAPYLAYARISAEFEIGAYDDSLSFPSGPGEPLDATLVYLDLDRFERMTPDELATWLGGRVHVLRDENPAPIVVVAFGAAGRAEALRPALESVVDVFVVDPRSIAGAESIPHVDERALGVSGTRVANGLQGLLARELASSVLPALLLPPIKAIAIDLDETLVRGVLGEDGVDGVDLTAGHLALQTTLRDLRERGTFLALVSRNVESDVEALFRERDDFPLRWDDFSVRRVGWGSKSDALLEVARELRIAPDAVLFVDDNPGELFEVLEHVPGVDVVLASRDAEQTRRAIVHHPGVRKLRGSRDDALRVRDLAANREREDAARTHATREDYLRDLEVTITRRYDALDARDRIAELCRKTNQFNLALLRTSAVDVERRMASASSVVISATLDDRLSSSGTVAVVLATRVDDRLVVEELCVSCRALGRGLEDSLVLASLLDAPLAAGCTEIAFQVAHGDRNEPALRWIASHLGIDETPAPGLHTLSIERLRPSSRAAGVRFLAG